MILKFSTTPGTALAGSDFIAQPDVAYTILPGNLSVTIPVQMVGDLIVEPEETFTGEITLVNANGQSVAVDPTNKTATGTITDNDQATFTISGFDKNEADGTGIFTISVDKEIQDEITVDFATSDGTAKAGLGLDYTAIGITTLHFGDGNLNSQTVSVTINDDNWVEPTEILNGILGNLNSNNQDVILTGGGATASATGTINDNDAAAISIDDMSVNEADGKAIFTVTLSGNIQDDLTLDYITNDASAIAGSDYTSISGTMTFAGGSLSGTQHTIEVPILNDEVAEPKETYAVDLKDLICTGSSSFGDNQGLGTILDNDPMTLALSGFEITETEAAQTSYFVVTSNISAQKDIEITFTTADISATSSSDYTAQTAHTYTLVAGQKTWNIPIEILGDAIAEPIETFTGTIALSNDNAQQVTIPVAGETATSTIYDNDAIVINLSGFIVTETESTQNKDFTVSLNTSAQYDIVLNFSTSDGTTQAGNDFTAQSGTLVTIPHGSTSVTIPMAVLGDNVLEPTETFTGTITLNTINGQQVTIGTGTTTFTIIDNDAASLAIQDISVAEGEDAVFTVTLTGNVQGSFTINYTTADGTAKTLDPDYTAKAGTLTFSGNNGEAYQIIVPTIDDDILEHDENFVLNLSNISNTLVTYDNQATATIVNDDNAKVTMSDVSGNEDNGAITLTATLDHAVQGGFTVDVNTADGTAKTSDNDYSSITGHTLTFVGNAGRRRPSRSHSDFGYETGIGRNRCDQHEQPVIDYPWSRHHRWSYGNDSERWTMQKSRCRMFLGMKITEAITLTATLDHAVQGGFTVDVNTADGTAKTSDNDYSSITGHTLTFVGNAGETPDLHDPSDFGYETGIGRNRCDQHEQPVIDYPWSRHHRWSYGNDSER